MENPKDQSCASCFFAGDIEGEIGVSLCRRHPPRLNAEDPLKLAAFPLVESTWWCGEYTKPGAASRV
jgi:hypothetical protein